MLRTGDTPYGTGRTNRSPAKTRSWAKAEQQAQKIRDGWDPVKQKLRELGELQEARELGEVTITYALERWLILVKADSDSGNEHTHSKYQGFATGPSITPSGFIRKNIVITTSGMFSDEPFVCAMNALGEDSVMYSVDHPFDSMSAASSWFDRAPVSESVREKISSGNATRILKL